MKVLGGPVSAATLAAAMYSACSAAEKVARKDALVEIAAALKNPDWTDPYRATTLARNVFDSTFGERHFTWKTAARSLLATSITVLCIIAMVYLLTSRLLHVSSLGTMLAVFFIFAAIPDYLALWKTRHLLRLTPRGPRLLVNGALLSADVLLSALISVVPVLVLGPLAGYSSMPAAEAVGLALRDEWKAIGELWYGHGSYYPIGVFLASTLFTSVWMFLVLCSTTALTLLAPVRRFTSWFFNVDEHPLQAIGVVSGALVIVGWMICALLRLTI